MSELILTSPAFEIPIKMREDYYSTLVIENKKLFLNVLTGLRQQVEEGEDGDFYLLLNSKSIGLEKSSSIIFDFTAIDFNSKAIGNLLLKKFTDFVANYQKLEYRSELENIIVNLAEDFRLYSNLNIEYDAEPDANAFAKMCSLKIQNSTSSLLEKLCEYVNLICELKPLKLFILVFCKEFLSGDEISRLQQHCSSKGVRLLLLENTDVTVRSPNEERIIIDEDLCVIGGGE